MWLRFVHLIADAAANQTILYAEIWDTMNIEVVQWNKYENNQYEYVRERYSDFLIITEIIMHDAWNAELGWMKVYDCIMILRAHNPIALVYILWLKAGDYTISKYTNQEDFQYRNQGLYSLFYVPFHF